MNIFNINTYLDQLTDNVLIIDMSYKKISHIPDLSRFRNLEILICNNNNLEYLPTLPVSLITLLCHNNKLITLPYLLNNLLINNIDCSNNRLKFLPKLPINLVILKCDHNLLIQLPKLPSELENLCCSFNKLSSLPNLPNYLTVLTFNSNYIYNIVFNSNIQIIKKNIKKLNNFRYFYYSLKYKIKIIQWYWKSQESFVIKKYHPKNLINLITDKNNENDNIDEIIKKLDKI
jgi:hypothetical protein